MNTVRIYERPSRVSIACYLLWSSAALNMTFAILRHYYPRHGDRPLPMDVMALALVAGVALSASAVFMYRGINRGRIAFYIFCVASIVGIIGIAGFKNIDLAVAGFNLLLPGAFLATRRAHLYFTGKDPDSNPIKSKRKNDDASHSSRRSAGRYDY